jgi:hypothetical protein
LIDREGGKAEAAAAPLSNKENKTMLESNSLLSCVSGKGPVKCFNAPGIAKERHGETFYYMYTLTNPNPSGEKMEIVGI